MQRVEKVSIGKYGFILEEDAYALVKEYISELESFYNSTASGKEVMEGIEERMAELLLEKCGQGNVVDLNSAKAVIDILGRPETIENESGRGESSEKGADKKEGRHTTKKRLYRISSRYLGGVCNGIAAYFNADVAIVRLIALGLFVITTLCEVPFVIPIVYIICWIAMPRAITVQQKLEAKGEGTTVNEIAEKVGSTAREFSETIATSSFWRTFGRILSMIVGILFIVIGISGIITAGVVLFGLESGIASTLFDNLGGWLNEFSHPMWDNIPHLLLKILGMIVIFVPFIAFLYSGIILTFDLRPPKWKPGLILFIVWLIAILAALIFFICFW